MHAAVQRSGSSRGRRRAHSAAGAAASNASATRRACGRPSATSNAGAPSAVLARAQARNVWPAARADQATTCERGTPVLRKAAVDERGVERHGGDGRAWAATERQRHRGGGKRMRRHGAQARWMAPGERRRRGAVPPAACEQCAPTLRLAVVDRAAGVVANAPPAVVQAPDEVDVFAVAQAVVERRRQRTSPDDERRGGDVGNAAVRDDAALPRAHVQRRAGGAIPLSCAERSSCRDRRHPRRDRGNERIREVAGESAEPSGRGHAVAVDEGDQLGRRDGQGGISCGRRSGGVLEAQQSGPMATSDLGDRGGVAGAVVDDDHGKARVHRRQAAGERSRAVARGNDHGDRCTIVARRPRMGEASVDEATCQLPACRPTGRPASSARRVAAPSDVSRITRAGVPPASSLSPR